jgi:hypothetical protein
MSDSELTNQDNPFRGQSFCILTHDFCYRNSVVSLCGWEISLFHFSFFAGMIIEAGYAALLYPVLRILVFGFFYDFISLKI